MVRASLDARLEALESRVTPVTALTREQVDDILAAARSVGKTESEAHGIVMDRDPTVLRRGFFSPAEQCVHDSPTLRMPNWAGRHPDPLVQIVGRLEDGDFSVATGEHRHPVSLPSGVDWRTWDEATVFWLSLLVHALVAWRTYWSRSREFRRQVDLYSFYLGSARKRTARWEREVGAEAAHEGREELSRRIEWVLGTEEEPERIPWHKDTAA